MAQVMSKSVLVFYRIDVMYSWYQLIFTSSQFLALVFEKPLNFKSKIVKEAELTIKESVLDFKTPEVHFLSGD